MGGTPRCCQIWAILREMKCTVLHVQCVRETERDSRHNQACREKKINTEGIFFYVYSFCNSETKKHTNITQQYGPIALLNLFFQTWFNCDNIYRYLYLCIHMIYYN